MNVRTTFFLCALMMLCVPFVYAENVLDKLNVHGFFENSVGLKLRSDNTKHENFNLLEQRLQLKAMYYPQSSFLSEKFAELNFKGDITLDEHFGGKTGFELREANLFLSPFSWVDLKLGRQVFTWGVGEYLFINDLFPKDYISFFVGKEDEYLKKPSDGVKVSLFNKNFNLDIMAFVFEQNTLPQGDRLSFLDTFTGGIAGRNSDRHIIEPSRQFNNTEVALRFYRNFGSYEGAGYFFRGFYKNPRGYWNEALRQLYYPRLDVYGGSLRGPLLRGIAKVEAGFYNSREDSSGADRLIENSAFKVMAGYDKDLGNDLGVGFQYLYEQTLDYDNYQNALLANDFIWDEFRHLITLRVTKQFLNQTRRLSLFTFLSPSDEDIYIRPVFSNDLTDSLKVIIGANLIWGDDEHTQFGQMKRNSNIYVRARYSF